MTTSEFKKVGRLLKQIYKELELEALKEGIDLMSPQYDLMVANAREAVLLKMGFTLEEYREVKAQVEAERKILDNEELSKTKLGEVMHDMEDMKKKHIHTREEIFDIAREVAKEVAESYIKQPEIINKTVKEIIIKEPQIIEKTIVENKTINVEYDEKPLLEKLGTLSKKVDEIKVPDPIDVEKLKTDLKGDFGAMFEMFEKNIDMLGMPNFRKLAMGLQQQIDELSNDSGGGTVETPTGTVDGSNTTFTATRTPKWIVVDGLQKFETEHYTLTGLTIEITDGAPPAQYIRAVS